jgi:16S rRNA G527 N7-methylase RsmG
VNPTLTKFATELLRWNERINLTAARTMNDALQHIEDSSAILQ